VLIAPNSFLRRLVYQEVRGKYATAALCSHARVTHYPLTHLYVVCAWRVCACVRVCVCVCVRACFFIVVCHGVMQLPGAQCGEGAGHVGQHVDQPHERGGEGQAQGGARPTEARRTTPPLRLPSTALC